VNETPLSAFTAFTPATSSPPGLPASPPAASPSPVELGDASPGPLAADLGAQGQPVLDALREHGARSFQVPFVLILAFLGYLAVQRGVAGGPLPMIAHPPVGEPVPGETDDRYRL
jgi:hypothetical protein